MSTSDTPGIAPGSQGTGESWAPEELRRLTIGQIERLVQQWDQLDDCGWGLLEQDERIGVRRLGLRYRRRLQAQAAEQQRLQALLELERGWWQRGVTMVAGVDEVGRGCLAGPVVAAAVVLPADIDLSGLDDSKKLTPEKRRRLAEQIRQGATAWALGQVEAPDIDRTNILRASLAAMRQALSALGVSPGRVLVDGQHLPGSPFAETAVVDGDARSLSIAAASVVAKVHRDELMAEYAGQFPQYGFERHKGYGSADHIQALKEHGPCPLHRRSFGPVADLIGSGSEAFGVFKEGLKSSQSRQELAHLGQLVGAAAAELANGEIEALRRVYRSRRRQLEQLGRRGEDQAAQFLETAGYQILARGYRGSGGEIDLVARRGDSLVFVEVKSSGSAAGGHPEERVDQRKRNHLRRAAQHYLAGRPDAGLQPRFDVIAVQWEGGAAQIVHLENAFPAS